MNWTRDRVRRLARIQRNTVELTMDLRALIHELGAEDPGKEKLVAANEALHQGETVIAEALDAAKAIWELTDALAEVGPPTIEEMSGSVDFGEGFSCKEYLNEIRGRK